MAALFLFAMILSAMWAVLRLHKLAVRSAPFRLEAGLERRVQWAERLRGRLVEVGLETGGGGWGNDELEYYTSRPQNAWQQDGNLVIKVLRREIHRRGRRHRRNYTSARLKTLGKFSQAYGRFEARMKIPRGQGIWPAFWMLGNDIEKPGWPDCGEIDIMENIGKEPAIVHGTIHGPGYSGANGIGSSYALCRATSALPTTFTSSPSSGNRMRFASTSTIISTRRALQPICRKERSGFTTIHSSCCSMWRWAETGREIRTRPASSRRPCWWIMCGSTNPQRT